MCMISELINWKFLANYNTMVLKVQVDWAADLLNYIAFISSQKNYLCNN